MVIGDSISVGAGNPLGGFRAFLLDELVGAGDWTTVGYSQDYCKNGQLTDGAATGLAALIAGRDDTQAPKYILVGLGANDIPQVNNNTLTKATWLASMGSLLDQLHEQWPEAQIRLSRPYHGYFPSAQDIFDDNWMPDVFIGRETFAAFGPDTRTYLPGNMGDNNGDPVHPSVAGQMLMASNWATQILTEEGF